MWFCYFQFWFHLVQFMPSPEKNWFWFQFWLLLTENCGFSFTFKMLTAIVIVDVYLLVVRLVIKSTFCVLQNSPTPPNVIERSTLSGRKVHEYIFISVPHKRVIDSLCIGVSHSVACITVMKLFICI